ncbi:MAG: ribosome maturation factor RimM [Spirochaetes bacterium]|jgi:16S rRNA processing protein RimM|nr:ribosome maturation factor RimM [Spirochaetota bacterium]
MEMLAAGVVSATHGLKGELTIRSFSGRTDHIAALAEVLLRRGGEERRVRVLSVRPKPPNAVMRIDGVDSLEQARRYVGFEIWVPREAAAPLAEGEYYMADICRCGLFFGDERIGDVRSVMEAGASPLLEVRDLRGKTLLVPFVERFIGGVDVREGKIQLRDDEIVR